MINLKETIEQEINKINNLYDTVFNDVSKSFELKHEQLYKLENDLKEKLQNEVTKAKEKLENFLSECNNLIKMCERINKITKKEEIHENNNILRTLTYISNTNIIQKETRILMSQLMKNIKFNFEEDKTIIKYEEYFFCGIPIPNNISIRNINMENFEVAWNVDDILTIDKNKIKFKIELRKENEKFQQIYEGKNTTNIIKGLSRNTYYEIRICSVYDMLNSPWGEIKKVKTRNQPNLGNLFG